MTANRIFTHHLEFELDDDGGLVKDRQSGDILGMIEWYGMWREFIFDPSIASVFSCDCLTDIAAQISRMNARSEEENPNV